MSSSLGFANEGNDDAVDGVFGRRPSDGFKPTLDQPRQLANRSVQALFGLAVLLITVASMYDAFLVYKYREGIVEQNPICNWLIRQDPKSVSLFLIAKGAGTAGVVSVLIGLFAFWRRAGITAAISLVVFQAGLMFYLHTSEISHPVRLLASANVPNDASATQPIEKGKHPTRTGKRKRAGMKSIGDSRRQKRSAKQDSPIRVHPKQSHPGKPKKTRAVKPGHLNIGLIELASR